MKTYSYTCVFEEAVDNKVAGAVLVREQMDIVFPELRELIETGDPEISPNDDTYFQDSDKPIISSDFKTLESSGKMSESMYDKVIAMITSADNFNTKMTEHAKIKSFTWSSSS